MKSDLASELSNCRICPRECGADRLRGAVGFCGVDSRIRVARIALHHWEEPPLSGTCGSGAIFFAGCNLGCVFCQNHPISHQRFGAIMETEELADECLRLQAAGAHNINLVTGSHFIPQIAAMLQSAKSRGLIIPVVYNTSAYEKVDALRHLAGLVDVYLPDLKYRSVTLSQNYSGAADYFTVASRAILEMFRQCGPVVLSPDGIIRSGLIIRHLILPGTAADSKDCLRWIKANLPAGIFVSLMAQYYPLPELKLTGDLNRKITNDEYEEVLDELFRLGMEDGFVQELDSAAPDFIPDFDLTGVPIKNKKPCQDTD
jgi:putative pyruvate formate lyase activating enzyme